MSPAVVWLVIRLVWVVIGEQNATGVSDALQMLIYQQVPGVVSTMDYSCQYEPFPRRTECIGWSLDTLQPGDVVSGVIVWRGERAARTCQDAGDWDVHLEQTVQALRDGYGRPDLPVYFAQLGRRPAGSGYPCWGLVKRRQAAVMLDGVRMVRTDGVPRMDKSTLYDERGLTLLARRFWRAMH